MRTSSDRAAGIVQKESQVKNKRILKFFEDIPIWPQFWIFCLHHLVQLIDADESVFVCGVAMKEFVLDQAGELTKLGNITAKKIHPVHHSKDPAHLAFSREY